MFKRNIKTVIVVSSLAFSSSLFAGAFQLWEQDASGLGDYHAGSASEADTAGGEFYNVAGITRLKKQEVSFGAVLIGVDVNYTGSVNVKQLIPVTQQVTDANGGTVNIVPNFHYVAPLPHNLWFSFGETTPFGLETDYDSTIGSVVSELATETKVQTINLNPGLAYKINRYLSIGAGFDAMQGSADYDSNYPVNLFTVNQYPLSNDLSGWGYGYNVGTLVQFTPETRLGVSYRSAVTIHASGDSTSNQAFTAPVTTTATASLPLPATTILSMYHDFTTRFSMMASAIYTQWDSFDQLVIGNMSTIDGSKTFTDIENYRNTWNLALGGKYRFNQYLSLEGGFGHDETPTEDGYRDIRLPDNNRWAMSLGLNIQPRPGFIWSMGWTHFFVPSTAINNTNSDPSGTAPVGVGTETGDINVMGTQFSIAF